MTTTPADVRRALLARQEIALLDLREELPFSQAHPLFAACMALSKLELEAYDRLPRRDVPIVLYDDGEGLVAAATERLGAMGYRSVAALEGGLAGWRAAGFELFRDVNSYSKAFGELVEARRHTPSLPAPEAKALIDGGADMVVLDARRFDEYRTMSVPTGISVPGAELVLRAAELAPDPATTILVNCAGRTRSIIGAQSLINAGLPNPVRALRNGTIGWKLAGQALDSGQSRRFAEPAPEREQAARRAARAVAYRAGVRWIASADLAALERDGTRTLYRFDVRTPEEYAAGHLPGFLSAPGGQLVQETDMYAPVRGARIVLADDRAVRADMTASWLAQMGWDVMVLEAAFDRALETGAGAAALPPPPPVRFIAAGELRPGQATILDLAPSPHYRRGHVPGAWFAIRARLPQALARIAPDGDIVLTSPDGVLAQFAAPEVQALTGRAPLVVRGGTAAWQGDLETGATRLASEPEDVYRRPYEGTDNPVSAMQAYLDWEFGLVAQLERDGTHGFFVI